MKSVRSKLCCSLVVVCALAAVAAASASAALPEFSGSFPNTFEAKATEGLPRFQTVDGRLVLCESNVYTGEFTGSKAVVLKPVFTGCETSSFKLPSKSACQTAGAKAGEVKTAALEGKPYYVNGSKEVGVAFAAKGGGNVAEIECGSGTERETLKVKGSLIGTVKPINLSTTKFTLYFHDAGTGVQEPSEYESEGKKVKAILETEGAGEEAFAFEQTGGVWLKHESTAAKAVEVKASLASTGLPEFRSTQKFTGTIGRTQFAGFSSNWYYSGGTISGTITSHNEVAGVVIKLENGSPEVGCTNSEERYLVTSELVGRPGYINKASKTVGLLLEPRTGPIAACHSKTFGSEEYIGSIIGELTPVNKSTKTFNLKFHSELRSKEEHQIPEAFEGEEVMHHLEEIYVGSHYPMVIREGEAKLETTSEDEVLA